MLNPVPGGGFVQVVASYLFVAGDVSGADARA
jgi:hypothetical protein